MLKKPKNRTLLSALWAGSLDTAEFAAVFVVVVLLQRLRRGHAITIPTGRTLTLTVAVLFVVWSATVVACRFGASTTGDYLGGPPSGLRSRVPGTLVVAGITGLVAFIVLLFAGFLE